MKGLIAVDGGGTKTEFILANEKGMVLTKTNLKGTNLNSCSYEDAFLTLATGVKQVFDFADKHDVEIAGAYFGLAGGVNGQNKSLVYNYFKSCFFENIPFSNDGDELNAVNTGLKNAPNGIVVIAGTGSNVSIKKDGIVLPNPQLSGWGYMFDNGGSGYDFGRDAIIAAKKSINGTGKPTIIKDIIEQKMGKPVFDCLKDVYSNGPSFVGKFCPVVFQAYKQGDEVAGEIFDNQMNNIADLINSAHNKIGAETEAEVGLVGGVFTHDKEIILPKLTTLVDKNLNLSVPEESQSYGALMEAAKNAGIETNTEFLENYRQTIIAPLFQEEQDCVQ